MSKIHSLDAEERLRVGTGGARAVRMNNMVPAIIYGGGKEQVLIALPYKELTLEYRKQGFLSHMFDIKVGNNKYRVLPKAIQLHPVTDEIEHMDFVHVDLNQKINVTVTLHFINESKCLGIKAGGILNIARHNLEVYCLPDNIPEFIEIDIENLVSGQSIHLSDVKLPEGIETKMDLDTTVAALVAAKSSSEESADAEKSS